MMDIITNKNNSQQLRGKAMEAIGIKQMMNIVLIIFLSNYHRSPISNKLYSISQFTNRR